MKYLISFRKALLILVPLWAYLSPYTYAQKNPDIPKPRGPVDLSETANVVMFIILPALVLIGYFFWRSAMKKRRDQ